MIVGRLAPTPSGMLHLGNVTAFAAAWLAARSAGGRVLLRVEDVDRGRARPEVEASQKEDLLWLGLDWDEETTPQRDRDYRPFLNLLSTYRCTCTRKMIRAAGGTYPGTCRNQGHTEGSWRWTPPAGPVRFTDLMAGQQSFDPAALGDPVLRRRDEVFCYPLAVVADDIVDGVTQVVRGADLLEHTAVQIALWQALGATPPTFGHAPLVRGENGAKLSKSAGSVDLRQLRATGADPAAVWRIVLPWLGLPCESLEAAISAWDPSAVGAGALQWPPPSTPKTLP